MGADQLDEGAGVGGVAEHEEGRRLPEVDHHGPLLRQCCEHQRESIREMLQAGAVSSLMSYVEMCLESQSWELQASAGCASAAYCIGELTAHQAGLEILGGERALPVLLRVSAGAMLLFEVRGIKDPQERASRPMGAWTGRPSAFA